MSVKHKKIILAVAMLFAVNILIIALAQSADAALYKRGSSGATVTQIQTRLKSWGYYSGSVDGIYGSATESAVKYFQRKNGLNVDGQAGDKTLAALGIYEPASAGSAASGNVYLLAQPIADSAYRAAREALAGSDPTGGAIYYFNPATATSKWIWSRPQMLTIGSHIFCA